VGALFAVEGAAGVKMLSLWWWVSLNKLPLSG